MERRKRSKYGVDQTQKGKKKRTFNGQLFDSLTELNYLREVILPLMEAGTILSYERQIPFILQKGFTDFEGNKIRPIKYVADYVCHYKDGHTEVIDVKGNPDQISKLKKKLYLHQYPDTIYYWMVRNLSKGGWMRWEELEKIKKQERKKKKENV